MAGSGTVGQPCKSDDSGLDGGGPASPLRELRAHELNEQTHTAGEAAMPRLRCWEWGALMGWAPAQVSFGPGVRTARGETRSPPDSTQRGLTAPWP